MGSTQLPVLWLPELFPGKAVVACIELPPLFFVSRTGQPLSFKSEYTVERGSGKLVSPLQTTRRHNPEDGSMTTEWYVYVLVATVCDFIRELRTH
jgi:hypothetical protein